MPLVDKLLTTELVVFMFKQKNGMNPIVFKDIIIKNRSIFNTRNKSNFIPKRYSSTVCQQSILYYDLAY